GNLIGTNAAGTAAVLNDDDGVTVTDAPGTVIGGTQAGAGNLISGNDNDAIFITGDTADRAVIQGNFLGTNAAGTAAIPNDNDAIFITAGSDNNLIGGGSATARNLISGNNGFGVSFNGFLGLGSTGNRVQGNLIGTDVTGTQPIPNTDGGISFFDAAGNIVGDEVGGETDVRGAPAALPNVIAFNGGPGVAMFSRDLPTLGNAVLGNSIFSNGELGIDLGGDGVTPNDGLQDKDTGPNELQNFPVLTSAVGSASSLTVQGTLSSSADRVFIIELFASSAGDPSGFGEGQFFLGRSLVTTDGSGEATFSMTVSSPIPGGVLTATATDPLGDTSEFSASLPFGSGGDTTPPVLADCQVSPRQLPNSGGTVQLSVNASDDVGLANVSVVLTNPDGTTTTLPLKAGKGPFFTTFTAPPNNTPRAQVYGVRFTAEDTSDNTASLPCGTFSVAPLAVTVTAGQAAGSGLVDVSALAPGLLGEFNLDVLSTGRRPRGSVNFTVVGLQGVRGGTFRARSVRLDSFSIAEGSGGRTVFISGVMQTNLFGRVGFTVEGLDGGSPGVPADSFVLTLIAGGAPSGLGGTKSLTLGGHLQLYQDHSIRLRNDLEIRTIF
ncbi:MAG TPA: hypothetical protein VFU47_17530, partial [Armatimonadota bacterium]|nr:hypothetical protein [Armatimonadota bacterium]